jgi:hypothetical protein
MRLLIKIDEELFRSKKEKRDAKTHANPSSLLVRSPHGKVLTGFPHEPVSYSFQVPEPNTCPFRASHQMFLETYSCKLPLTTFLISDLWKVWSVEGGKKDGSKVLILASYFTEIAAATPVLWLRDWKNSDKKTWPSHKLVLE